MPSISKQRPVLALLLSALYLAPAAGPLNAQVSAISFDGGRTDANAFDAQAVPPVTAAAAVPSAAPVSRTQRDEAVVSRACKSNAPVLVVDAFPGGSNEPDTDLNGNGHFDAFHGDLVSKLIERNGQRVIRANIDESVTHYSILPICDMLNGYADKIERGELSISWINISRSYPVPVDKLNLWAGTGHEITSQNLQRYADRIVAVSFQSDEMKRLYDVFKRFQELGIPIFLGAGNSPTSDWINFYSLFPNVISVGALDLNGKKAAYSADNSAVTLWRNGNVKTYAVPGGIALAPHGPVQFAVPAPQIPQDLLDSLDGKPAESIKTTVVTINDKDDPAPAPKGISFLDKIKAAGNRVFVASFPQDADFLRAVSMLPRGLYSTSDLLSNVNILLHTDEEIKNDVEYLGEYFYMDGSNQFPLLFLKVDDKGNLIVPKRTMPPGNQLRNVIQGTSYAAPNICDGERTPQAFAY